MAGRMGVSLSKTNFVLSELAEKGIIKVKRFKNAPHKTPCTYMLTPHGLEQKTRITVRFLKQKLSEYETMKAQIKEVAADFKRGQNMDAPETGILEKLKDLVTHNLSPTTHRFVTQGAELCHFPSGPCLN